MLYHTYNSELDILLTITANTLVVEEIIGHYEKLANYNSMPENLKVLIDCRDTKFKIKPHEMALTIDALRKAVKNYESVQEAIMVIDPYETAIASIFENFSSGIENYNFKIFYTDDAGISWLKRAVLN